MPPKSKAQFRFAKAAESGRIPGVSSATGKEILGGRTSPKGLPARKTKKGK